MEQTESLEARLSSVEHGSVAFKVLALVFCLLGVVLAAVAVAASVSLIRSDLDWPDVILGSVTPALNCVTCFMLFWFLNRISALFCTTAALIRELREVV